MGRRHRKMIQKRLLLKSSFFTAISLSVITQSAVSKRGFDGAILRSSGAVSRQVEPAASAFPSRSVTPLPEGKVNRLRRVDRCVQIPLVSHSAMPSPPVPLTLEFRVHDSTDGTGLARRVVPISKHHLAVMPLPLVEKLALYFTHPGSACAFGVLPAIIPFTFRSSITNAWNLLTRVEVIRCWVFLLSPVTRLWSRSLRRCASHQPRLPDLRRACALYHRRSLRTAW